MPLQSANHPTQPNLQELVDPRLATELAQRHPQRQIWHFVEHPLHLLRHPRRSPPVPAALGSQEARHRGRQILYPEEGTGAPEARGGRTGLLV